MLISTVKYCSLLLIPILLFIQCRTSQTPYFPRKEYEQLYINEFKLRYFRKVLQAGFNQSEAIKSLTKFDRSGFTEPVLSEGDYRFLDSMVYIDNLQMVTDSINQTGRVAEGAEGKHVFEFILNKLESKYLDSIAKVRYKSSDFYMYHK